VEAKKGLADLAEDDLKAFTTEWEVNAMGPLRTVVALQSKLKDGAKIVLLGTTLSSNANNKDGGIYGYRASKAALHNIGVTLANELKDKEALLGERGPYFLATKRLRYDHKLPVSS